MQIPRSRERFIVDIPIVITTVLENMEGVIVDLSEGGAQIIGCSLPPRTQCQIDLDGYVVFGAVRWSEEDRMGIRFPFPMTEGPLFDMLENTKVANRPAVSYQPRPATPRTAPVAGFGGGSFGRRRA